MNDVEVMQEFKRLNNKIDNLETLCKLLLDKSSLAEIEFKIIEKMISNIKEEEK